LPAFFLLAKHPSNSASCKDQQNNGQETTASECQIRLGIFEWSKVSGSMSHACHCSERNYQKRSFELLHFSPEKFFDGNKTESYGEKNNSVTFHLLIAIGIKLLSSN
jgi:hypothetical protein